MQAYIVHDDAKAAPPGQQLLMKAPSLASCSAVSEFEDADEMADR